MTFINTVIPFISAIISFIFAFIIFKRYAEKRGPHLLLWGLGMLFYGIGGFCEAYFGAFGWNALIFRMWYLFGAILVAAWLGQGTVYLLVKRRYANILMLILGVASAYAAMRVFGAELDPGRCFCICRYPGFWCTAGPQLINYQRAHRKRIEWTRHCDTRHPHANALLQYLWCGYPGRWSCLLSLDFLSQTSPASPRHWQYPDCCRSPGTRLWRRLQPLRNSRCFIYR